MSLNIAVLNRMQEIARRVERARWERATAMGRKAGLGDYRNVWHNAMIARDNGRPWAEVDYRALRAAIHIDALPSASEIVDRYYRRVTTR